MASVPIARRFKVAMHWAQKATPSWSRSHCRTALPVTDTGSTRSRLPCGVPTLPLTNEHA